MLSEDKRYLGQLAKDLGVQIRLRTLGVVLAVLAIALSTIWLMRGEGDGSLPKGFYVVGVTIAIFIVVLYSWLLYNFSNIERTSNSLLKLMRVADARDQLLYILSPMLDDALSLKQDDIKSAMIGRLIEAALIEVGSGESNAIRLYLKNRPKEVQTMLRRRLIELQLEKRAEFPQKVTEYGKRDESLPPHWLDAYEEEMRRIDALLELFPEDSNVTDLPLR